MKNEMNKKDKSSHIGQFLISRFFFVMILIYFINSAISWFSQQIIYPFMINELKVNEIVVGQNDLSSRLKLFVLIILRLIPSRLPGFIDNLIYRPITEALGVEILAPENVMERGNILTSLYYLFIVLIMFVLLLISLLPYIMGCTIYTLLVKHKMDELREYDRQRTREYESQRNLLLSDIAHDIKTPITSMTGYAKALSDGLVPVEQQKDYLNSIYTKSMRVSELINMLFEYIKLDSAGYTLTIEEDDVAELAREVAASMYQDFEDASIEFDVDIEEQSCIYPMDKLQLSRVITNLMSNTIKYLNAGDKVFLSLKKYDKKDGNPGYEIRVEDSGAQIDDELAEVIFTPFTRGDKTRSSKGGNGLGLSIAHKIIELHGGELILDRNLDDGYTKAFIVKL